MNRRSRSLEEVNALRKNFYERIDLGNLTIPDAVRAMRAIFDMTQAEFSVHRRVSEQTVQDLELGRGQPDVESLNRIASIFKLQAQPSPDAEGALVLVRRRRDMAPLPQPRPAQGMVRERRNASSGPPVHRYPLNTRGRDFVVGDIHGCFALLDAELAAQGFDPARDRLFSVGDLVDRGEASPAVLDAVHRHQIKAVRGNHEQMILDWALNGGLEQIKAYKAYLADPHADADSMLANVAYRHGSTSALLYNGGEWFVELYTSDVNATSQLGRGIIEYFSSLPWAIEIETAHGAIGVVHADVPCVQWSELIRVLEKGRFDHPVREQVLWDRRRWRGHEVSTQIVGVTAVIVGHTPTREAAQRGNVINIDTGAVYGCKLTVFDLADVRKWVVHGDRPFSRL